MGLVKLDYKKADESKKDILKAKKELSNTDKLSSFVSSNQKDKYDKIDVDRKITVALAILLRNLHTYKDKANSKYQELTNIINTIKQWDGSANDIKKDIKNNLKDQKLKKLQTNYKKLVGVVGVKKAKQWLKKQPLGNKVVFSKNSKSIIGLKSAKTKNVNTSTSSNKNSQVNSKMSKTNAKVVNNKSKSKSKNIKDTGKSKKKKTSVVSASALAVAAKREKNEAIETINKGTANKIEQAKLNLNNKLVEIDNDKNTKIAQVEADRDSKIAKLYDEAKAKINNIDPSSSDAEEQIKSIKTELENDIKEVNDSANSEIAIINKNAESQINEAKAQYQTEIDNIQASSEKEINNINQNGVQEKTDVRKGLEKAAQENVVGKDVDTSSLENANINKDEAASTRESSTASYSQSLTAKEQEIANRSNNMGTVTDSNSSNNENVSQNEQTITIKPESEDSNNSNNINNSYGKQDTIQNDNIDSPIDSPNVNENNNANIVETPAVPDDVELIPDNPNDNILKDDSSSIENSSEVFDIPKNNKKGSNVAIPIGLGIAATGAAAVAGVRFAKNRKQKEDTYENYDDENNELDDYESNSDYMKDDYLGPAGSMYQDAELMVDDVESDIPDDTQYTNADYLEQQLQDDSFTEDEVLNDLG